MSKITNKLWSKQEEELLSSIFETNGIKKSSIILNRTESSVAKKANRLGLKSKANCMTHEDYENKLFEKELDSYPIERYINTRTPIAHECLQGHIWKVAPHDVLAGNGCPECATYSFKPNRPTILYYIKISKGGLVYYKLGVTGQTINKRFQYDSDKNIKVLMEKSFDTGTEALIAEKELLSQYASNRVYIPGFLKSNGNTELFEIDILGLDRL